MTIEIEIKPIFVIFVLTMVLSIVLLNLPIKGEIDSTRYRYLGMLVENTPKLKEYVDTAFQDKVITYKELRDLEIQVNEIRKREAKQWLNPKA